MPKARRPVRAHTPRHATPGSGRPGAVRGPWIWLVLLAAAVILTFANSLRGPFTFDDPPAIEQNATIRQLWPIWPVLSPPDGTPVSGRPIVNLSFAINYAYGGLDVTSYHAVNVAVHLACALLLFGVVRRTLSGSRIDESLRASSDPLAFAVALLWALHPLQTEAINYVTQRTESMVGLCLLLTLYCTIRARRSRQRAGAWQGGAVLAAAVGMGTKESMAAAPLIVMLYDWAFESDSIREAWRTRWRFYVSLLSTWLLLAALMSSRSNTVGFSTSVSVATYLWNQCEMIVQYLRLVFWPRTLVLDYGFPRALGLGDVVGEAVLLLLLALATIVSLTRWPRIGFLGAVFFILLAPTSSVIPIATEVGAERRMYMPLAALVVLIVMATRTALVRMRARASLSPRTVTTAASAALVSVAALLAVRTYDRNSDYARPISLWRELASKRPNGRVRSHLAILLIANGETGAALTELREAVTDYPEARFMLGTELVAAGKLDEGLAELRRFVREKPRHQSTGRARELIAQTLAAQGKLDEAIDELQRQLEAAPASARAHGLLGDALYARSRYAEALPHYRALLEQEPNIPTVLAKVGVALAALGRIDEGIVSLQRAAELSPASPAIQRDLANAFLERRKPAQAEEHAKAMLQLSPRDPMAHKLLGSALAAQGKLDQAIDEFRAALQTEPSDAQAAAMLTQAAREKAALARSASYPAPRE